MVCIQRSRGGFFRLAVMGVLLFLAFPLARADSPLPSWILPNSRECADAPPGITIATFNVRIFSTRSRDDRELSVIASLMAPHDLVLIQELRDTEVMERLVRIMEARGEGVREWRATDPLGRGVKERYGWLWKPGVMEPEGDLLVLPDGDDKFIREPAAQRFLLHSGPDFLAAQVHLLFGDSREDRRIEAEGLPGALAWFCRASGGESEVFLAGDFNLSPLDGVFSALGHAGYRSLKAGEGTTISDSPYDTFWLSEDMEALYAGNWGMERFDETLYDGVDRLASREVSDHRPLWMLLWTSGIPEEGN